MATPAINGPDRSVATFADNTPTAVGVGGGIQFAGYTSSGIRSGLASIVAGKANGTSGDYGAYMTFMTRTNGSQEAERMRINNLGNVGIGTINPGALLDVSGHVANSGASASINSCGISPSTTGNDTCGLVNTGTGTVTSCIVSFASTYASTPICLETFNGSSAITTGLASSATTTALTLHFSASCASCGVNYYCSQ